MGMAKNRLEKCHTEGCHCSIWCRARRRPHSLRSCSATVYDGRHSCDEQRTWPNQQLSQQYCPTKRHCQTQQRDPPLQGISIHTAFQLARWLWRQASGCEAGFGAPLPSADCVCRLHPEVVAAASLQALHSELRGAAVIHLLKVLALVKTLQSAEHQHKESVASLLAWACGDANVLADVKLQRPIAGHLLQPPDCHSCPDSGIQTQAQLQPTA